MTYSTILYQVDDRVARITLNRPEKLNALSLGFPKFEGAVGVADRDPDVPAVVVTGAGGLTFSSAFNLNDGHDKRFAERTLEDWKARGSRVHF